MDVSPDVWGQLALEASQVYLTDGTAAKSPFAGTVWLFLTRFLRTYFNRFVCNLLMGNIKFGEYYYLYKTKES